MRRLLGRAPRREIVDYFQMRPRVPRAVASTRGFSATSACALCRGAPSYAVPPADVAGVEGGLAENPQLEEEEEEEQEEIRVSVVEVSESSGVLRSASMEGFSSRADEQKEGNCSSGSKEEALEKGQSDSGRGFLFSRLGRARSSSVLPF
ncbi:uncharacterized protein A4U43_C03F3290 [Asparagus officinalis]|uniref:Uncharacterized protein n=1 Tax=Asparagus officinalis TaxID=4686 RepID=A0A5P1FBZ3_ASPOF|nr:uncharacterized protein A4U43_C03F3290 [Asparagus officinalis]